MDMVLTESWLPLVIGVNRPLERFRSSLHSLVDLGSCQTGVWRSGLDDLSELPILHALNRYGHKDAVHAKERDCTELDIDLNRSFYLREQVQSVFPLYV